MNNLQLRKAERKKAKLRIGITSPSGGGKTYSALLLAKGIAKGWDKIAIIDTENGSGEMYSHLGGYNVITLTAPFSPERYIEAIQACEKAGMEVIIIDSATHEWDGKGGCLETNDLIARTKFKGNSWAAWSETTPKHQRFIEAIVTSPAHIITTTRSKTDMIQTEDKKIKKVGMKEIQREGFEYELTTNFNIDRDGHYAMASKDRTGLFIDRNPFLITEEVGKELIDWNESGKVSEEDLRKEERIVDITKLLEELKAKPEFVEKQVGKPMVSMSIIQLDKVYSDLMAIKEKRESYKKEEEPKTVQDVPASPVAEPQTIAFACEVCSKELTSVEVDRADNSKADIMVAGKKIKYICTKCLNDVMGKENA